MQVGAKSEPEFRSCFSGVLWASLPALRVWWAIVGTAVVAFSALAFVTHAAVILTAATGWQCAPSNCFAFEPLY